MFFRGQEGGIELDWLGIALKKYEHLRKFKALLIFNVVIGADKSKILKAINLFFNNQTDWKTHFFFQSDFNLDRLLEVREESIKGKQFIQISITFYRGNSYTNWSRRIRDYNIFVLTHWLLNVLYKDKIITFPLFNTCYPKNPARDLASFFIRIMIHDWTHDLLQKPITFIRAQTPFASKEFI